MAIAVWHYALNSESSQMIQNYLFLSSKLTQPNSILRSLRGWDVAIYGRHAHNVH